MSDVVELLAIRLTPVIELEPGAFSTQSHETPSGSAAELPDEWDKYWRASLFDSGISQINPIVPGSWHVSTTDMDSAQLEKVLRVIIDGWGGISSLDDSDAKPVLNGGLALSAVEQDILIEPKCCSDLSDVANWKVAAACEKAEWEMLWIGHPFLSVKYQQPWLLLSDLHESNSPVERWSVKPGELKEAITVAESELLDFSKRIGSILNDWGYQGPTDKVSLMLAGLES